MKGIRSFVAIELDDRVRDTLAQVREAIIHHAPEWADEKWVATENLHVTLVFLGSVDSLKLAEVSERLSSSLQGFKQFSLGLGDLVAMPPHGGRHTMLWATLIDSTGRCGELAQMVATAASASGVTLAERPFRPHVTLVRARRPRRLAREVVAAVSVERMGGRISMSVPSATLYSSTLTPRGPVYDRLAQWSFSGLA